MAHAHKVTKAKRRPRRRRQDRGAATMAALKRIDANRLRDVLTPEEVDEINGTQPGALPIKE